VVQSVCIIVPMQGGKNNCKWRWKQTMQNLRKQQSTFMVWWHLCKQCDCVMWEPQEKKPVQQWCVQHCSTRGQTMTTITNMCNNGVNWHCSHNKSFAMLLQLIYTNTQAFLSFDLFCIPSHKSQPVRCHYELQWQHLMVLACIELRHVVAPQVLKKTCVTMASLALHMMV